MNVLAQPRMARPGPARRVDLLRYSNPQQPRARLLCIPCAGGSPLEYRTWGASFADIEVTALRLPGRETRLRETLFRRIEPLAEAIVEALTDLPELPLALFGHSMGALVAFELARRLRTFGRAQLVHLFIAGRIGPQVQTRESRLFALPDADFVESVRAYGGCPPAAIASPEIMRLMIPTLRADFEAVETYDYQPGSPLDCPITVFGGQQDQFTSVPGMQAWAAQTRAGFDLHLLPGGHFFPRSQQPALVALLLRSLQGESPRRTP